MGVSSRPSNLMYSETDWYSGDKFVVMLEGLSGSAQEAATQAEAIGEKILAAVDEPYWLAGCCPRSATFSTRSLPNYSELVPSRDARRHFQSWVDIVGGSPSFKRANHLD